MIIVEQNALAHYYRPRRYVLVPTLSSTALTAAKARKAAAVQVFRLRLHLSAFHRAILVKMVITMAAEMVVPAPIRFCKKSRRQVREATVRSGAEGPRLRTAVPPKDHLLHHSVQIRTMVLHLVIPTAVQIHSNSQRNSKLQQRPIRLAVTICQEPLQAKEVLETMCHHLRSARLFRPAQILIITAWTLA